MPADEPRKGAKAADDASAEGGEQPAAPANATPEAQGPPAGGDRPQDDPKDALTDASRAARGAVRLLTDRHCDLEHGQRLLREGWGRLVGLNPDHPGTARALEAHRSDRRWTRSELLSDARELERAVQRAASKKTPRLPRVAKVLGLAAIFAALIVTLAEVRGSATYPAYHYGWRAEYYPALLFFGSPIERDDPNIEFHWNDGSPMQGIPDDKFSVRWDTCLHMPETRMVDLQLASDDGSRLFVDGKLTVDNWGDHAYQFRDGPRQLRKGTHHVMVEYYDKAAAADAVVRLTVPGYHDEPIPLSWLRVPRRPQSDGHVCEP